MGIFWPKSGQVVFGNDGRRSAGAKAYFFQSGTLTPRSTYQDAALTTPNNHPVVADGWGRMPAVFIDFDDYRERVQTSGGVTLWDIDEIPNPAPFTADLNVDPQTLLQTGQFVFEPIDATRAGFVRANGRTIGSAASVANERANADAFALYTYLYNALSNTAAPVSGGRGANAAADFSANKTLTLPDLRGRSPFGLDTMGNSAGSRFDASVPFTIGSATAPGSVAGQNHHVLTTPQAPSHTHTLTSLTTGAGSAHTHGLGTLATVSAGSHSHTITITDPGHGHSLARLAFTNWDSVHNDGSIGAGNSATLNQTVGLNTTGITASSDSQGAHTHTMSGSLANESAHTHSISGTSDATGGGGAHNNLPGALLGTWFIKL